VSRAHNVKGGEICPVLTSIGAAVAVGVIVNATGKHVLPELGKQYESHILPQVNKLLGTNEELKKVTTTPTQATKPDKPIVKNISSNGMKNQQQTSKVPATNPKTLKVSTQGTTSNKSGGGCSLM